MRHRLHHMRRKVLGDKSWHCTVWNSRTLCEHSAHESLGTRLRQEWIKLRQWADHTRLGKISVQCLITNQARKPFDNITQTIYMQIKFMRQSSISIHLEQHRPQLGWWMGHKIPKTKSEPTPMNGTCLYLYSMTKKRKLCCSFVYSHRYFLACNHMETGQAWEWE